MMPMVFFEKSEEWCVGYVFMYVDFHDKNVSSQIWLKWSSQRSNTDWLKPIGVDTFFLKIYIQGIQLRKMKLSQGVKL